MNSSGGLVGKASASWSDAVQLPKSYPMSYHFRVFNFSIVDGKINTCCGQAVENQS
jgi:hypothetical protein